MLRVLLVDDEPFITQGLSVLIDWEEEGYEIPATAANGIEALKYLEENEVDLIITDIKMPMMSGTELLEKVKTNISKAHFVILSGYNDFSYMKQAIRYECMDYILKPIQKEELLAVIRKVAEQYKNTQKKNKEKQLADKAYLSRNVIALLAGKSDEIGLNYIKEHLKFNKDIRYIDIEIDEMEVDDDIPDEMKRALQRKVYQSCLEYLGDKYSSHCIFDVSNNDKEYDIGFLYCKAMSDEKNMSEEEYLSHFLDKVRRKTGLSVIMFVGSMVEDITLLQESYQAAVMAKLYQTFQVNKYLYYHENEKSKNTSGTVLCKTILDELINYIELNDHEGIKTSIDCLYKKMNEMNMNTDAVNLNINYLVFHLIHLVTEQDAEVNQEEIMHRIRISAFNGSIRCSNKMYLEQFAKDCAEYLTQLRRNLTGGVLLNIEREVKEHYAENLTLKDLSKKYYVNSAYLGQIFRKKYGVSFKDYLNNYRMEQAVSLLLRTKKHIYEISEEVGYKNLDYFINRFIAIKGCTPAKYRKQLRENG